MRAYYSDTIANFRTSLFENIWTKLTSAPQGDILHTQRHAWQVQIEILNQQLQGVEGQILLEYSIPRLGKRIDAVLLIEGIVFVIEFKVGSRDYSSSDLHQVWDYALDLKYFHEASHDLLIVPILVATESLHSPFECFSSEDKVLTPLLSNGDNISNIIRNTLNLYNGKDIDNYSWTISRYAPTPTIIEAAKALYNNHSVDEISRSDASAINLNATSNYIFNLIEEAKAKSNKTLCFVTGVPGAGKTLVGLNISTKSTAKEGDNAVYLSGNGPLVKILTEALTRDKVKKLRESGEVTTKKMVSQEVKAFIQNVHHFRDACLDGTKINDGQVVADLEYFKTEENKKKSYAPIDHIVIFDEAQRAWTQEQTSKFMKTKKNVPEFPYSEPEFLISCMDRHNDWATIVCLVGGGQEINTGEAGISEWIKALNNRFKDWHIHISSKLIEDEYAAGNALRLLEARSNVFTSDELHLSVSLRSFRAENLASFVQHLLDRKKADAIDSLKSLDKYPIVLTRCIDKAKEWLRHKSRGSERYGIIVSSQAYRLKPLSIDVRFKPDPVHWFLSERDDVRSSYYLEDVVTEFDIQGLELDYTCVVWDGDFRYDEKDWGTYSFVGNKWRNIRMEERKKYLKNAYRVLLTRARQGMIIVVPEGDKDDTTRSPEFYNSTYYYLKELGLPTI